MGRLSRAVALSIGLLASALTAGAPPALAGGIEFGTPSATVAYGQTIEFVQPVDIAVPIARAEIRLRFADALGPQVIEVAPPAGEGSHVLRYTFDLTSGGHLLPNTPVSASWTLYAAAPADAIVGGPSVSATYRDDRFDWQTVSGDIVRVHWYEGSAEFGRRALEIGERAVAETTALLGVTEEAPIDFFVYVRQGDFYDALGPGTRENVGGQANAGIRTLFALISPREIDDPWVGVVVPHELVHLVFDTAVRNPYHFPPRWLNEGLAVYLSQGYEPGDRAMVEASARNGTIIPLDGLTGQFPTTRDRFFLAYAESVSAVDFLIREHGRDALVSLIRSYADGRTDDEAFRAALGIDAGEFGDAWLAELDAAAPTRYGPRPAPPGPLPAAWTDPAPAATPRPAGTVAPTTPGTDGGSGASTPIVLGGVAILAALALVVYGLRRRHSA
jgi:hypothetical protein